MRDEPEVLAAGGVVWRRGTAGAEFAVIHRPRYDDWSLPKGKLDPGESFEQAAAREVHEEIGCRVSLGDELPSAAYRDNKGRSKVVRYWLMEAGDCAFEPSHEVDEVRWLAAGAVRALLSYAFDVEVFDAAAGRLA